MNNGKGFAHNDLRFWVRAIYDMTGADVRFMVPDYEEVTQAKLDTIEAKLEEEDLQNANHMKEEWLYKGRALEAIGMREGDGYSKARTIDSYYSDFERPDKKAYIALARTNAEKSKGFLNNVPLSFECVAKNPAKDGEAVKALNFYREEILNQNNFGHINEKVISDMHDFGSGLWFTGYQEKASRPDHTFLRRRRKQGRPLSWEEYLQLNETKTGHVYDRVDTFKVIRDRRARGENSMFFENSCHTMFTIMDTITVTEAIRRYPKYESKISPGLNNIQRETNPEVHLLNNDELLTTIKYSWIKFPVRYEEEITVNVGNGITGTRKDWVQDDVWCCVVRLENAGIVDIKFDEYACGCPYTMVFRRASKHHAYGIGAYKDMHAPEWAFNMAFNGKFRWFNTASKRTTFTFGKVLTKDQHKARTKEGGVIEIDPKSLSPEQRDRSMNELVYTTDLGAFPSIYDNIERDMIYQLDRIGDMSSEKKAYTGRQQALLDNSQAEGMNPIVGNLEAAYLPLGQKFFSNIVEFDAEKEIRFVREDPVTGETEMVELNIPVGQVEQYDPITNTRKLYTYQVRNGLANLQYDTRIAARGIVPVNPTEKRFWIQDTMNQILALIESPKGTLAVEELNKKVWGGMFSDMVNKMVDYDQRRLAVAEQNEAAAMKMEKTERDRDFALKLKELEQNAYRLKEKAQSDQDKATAQLMNSIVQFMNGDAGALDAFMSGDSREALNGILNA